MLRIFLTDDALSSKVPQLTLRIADGDCIVKFQFVKQMQSSKIFEEYDYNKKTLRIRPKNVYLSNGNERIIIHLWREGGRTICSGSVAAIIGRSGDSSTKLVNIRLPREISGALLC